MAAETGIAIIVCFVPLFLMVYAKLMPTEGKFSSFLRRLVYILSLLFVTFAINVGYKFASVEGLTNIRNAFEEELLLVEQFIMLLFFVMFVSLLIESINALWVVVRQKHG